MLATNIIEVVGQGGQRGLSGTVAHGRGIWLVDTSQAIAATVKANRALSCALGLFAPRIFY